MTERQDQTVKNQDQQPSRKPYLSPELTRHGTVVELTHTPVPTDFFVGSGILTDGASGPG